jgi:hypothetical protein
MPFRFAACNSGRLVIWAGTAMRRLQVGSLAPEEVERAFPLVQAITPEVSLNEWTNCAKWFLGPGAMPSGILCAKDEQGYLAGLCCYRVLDVVDQGRTAVADRVIALGLIDPIPVADALIQGIEKEAEQLDCDTLQVTLFRSKAGREPPWLVSVLSGRGYERAASAMSKILRPQPEKTHERA